MSKRLVGLCGIILAAVLASPASAQIILGGEPVTTAPAEPAPVQLTFPINPDSAGYQRVSIAAPSFSGSSAAESDIAVKVAEVIRADLASLGIFSAPDSASISTFSADIGALPAWSDWGGAGAGALLLGKVVIGDDGAFTVQFRLYDVAARKQIVGSQYRLASADQWRRAAHMVADDVLVAIAGGKGGFDSRIAFVSESASKTRLGVVDSDGAASNIVLENVLSLTSPRFSPTRQMIVYSADAPVPGKPTQAQRTTITYDLESGARAPLTNGAQPNADARYSADGRSLIYSRKAGANTDIYLFTLSSGKETRLTDDKAADIEPALSPDATQFAFVSDRAGGQQVYIARVDGAALPCADGKEARACALTTASGDYDGVAWSPRGDLIAYSHRAGAEAAIHVVRPDGSGSRALTQPAKATLDLHPTWSPEGRRIAFSRLVGQRSSLHTVAIAGGEPRKLDVPGDAYEPDWSPKLP